MGSWGCPHELKGRCLRVGEKPCSPGMRGCVLHGRFVFSHSGQKAPAPRRQRVRRQD